MTKPEMKSAEEWVTLWSNEPESFGCDLEILIDVIQGDVEDVAFLAGAVAMREAAAGVVRFGPDADAIRAIDPKNLKGRK